MFRIKKPGISHYIDQMESGGTVSFSRYGDGEWLSILGRQGANCDRHQYFPEMSVELQMTLECPIPGITYGTYDWPVALAGYQGEGYDIHNLSFLAHEVLSWIESRNVLIDWHHSLVFHFANTHGQMGDFFKFLQGRKILLVGPEHLRQVSFFIPYRHFIRVPTVNCYLETDSIVAETAASVDQMGIDTVLFCASMATKCMIHRLYPSIGSRCSMIDLGSVLDPYCGVTSRPVYQRLEIQDNLKRNLSWMST